MGEVGCLGFRLDFRVGRALQVVVGLKEERGWCDLDSDERSGRGDSNAAGIRVTKTPVIPIDAVKDLAVD